MTQRTPQWSLRLADAAEQDFRDIYVWTAAKFGTAQAEIYAAALSSAIDALHAGPQTVGIKAQDRVAKGLWSLPVKLKRRRGRHHVFFRLAEQVHEVMVLRILHDAMDPARHLAK